jgi:hypothetical protein
LSFRFDITNEKRSLFFLVRGSRPYLENHTVDA